MKRLAYILGALFLVLIGVSSRASSPDFVHIGATVSTTGRFATEVGPFKNLFQAWADRINRDGGMFLKPFQRKVPLKVTVYDDRSREDVARRYYERLAVKDRVNLMIGPYSSPLTLAASVAAENRQVPFLAVCANSPRIYSRGFKWLVCIIDQAPRYTYRYWEMIKSEGRAQTIGFVVEDTLHPLGVYTGASVLARNAGLQEVSKHVFAADAQDFTSALVSLKKHAPDIIFVSANIPFSISFMKQALEFGLAPKEWHVIHHSGVFRRALGKNAELIVGQTYWTAEMKLGKSDPWIRLLQEAEIDPDDYPWAPAYLAAFMTAEAALAEAANPDKDTLMSTLKALDIATPLGRVRFNKKGSGIINTYPSQIQKGRYVIIWPLQAATGPHIYPAPYGR